MFAKLLTTHVLRITSVMALVLGSSAMSSWAVPTQLTGTLNINGSHGKNFNANEFIEVNLSKPVKLTRVTMYNRYSERNALATLYINGGSWVRDAQQYVSSGGSNLWYPDSNGVTSFKIQISRVDPIITRVDYDYEVDVEPTVVTQVKEVQVEVQKKLLKEHGKALFDASVELQKALGIQSNTNLGRAFHSAYILARDLQIASEVSGDVAVFNTETYTRLLDVLDSKQMRETIDIYYDPILYPVGSSEVLSKIDNFRYAVARLREVTKYFPIVDFSVFTPGATRPTPGGTTQPTSSGPVNPAPTQP